MNLQLVAHRLHIGNVLPVVAFGLGPDHGFLIRFGALLRRSPEHEHPPKGINRLHPPGIDLHIHRAPGLPHRRVGALGGEPQTLEEGGRIWLQNAGFIWVPFIILASLAAWFGMNDIASARASFKEQSVIFKRKHNWIMCVLYTGTFGSFIGYAAGFPLLMKTQFPEVDALSYAFLGPLVGALSRAGTGWISDRFGGGRVTFWTFLGMIAAVMGVLWLSLVTLAINVMRGLLTQPRARQVLEAISGVVLIGLGVRLALERR